MPPEDSTPKPVQTPKAVKAPSKKAAAKKPAVKQPEPEVPAPAETPAPEPEAPVNHIKTEPPAQPAPRDPWGKIAEQGSPTEGYHTLTEGLQTRVGVLIRDTVRITSADGSVSVSSSITLCPKGTILKNNHNGLKTISGS